MFRKMRRKTKEISLEDAKDLLKQARYGILAVNGDGGYPYAVPINYLYDESDDKIYFHGSNAGHKADSINNNDKVCFTVIGNEEIVDETWAPYVKSAVVFGKCHIINDAEETIGLCRKFARKYYPSEDLIDDEMLSAGDRVHMYVIEVEHISGKKIQEK